MATRDYLNGSRSDLLDSILPLITVLMSLAGLVAVPFVLLDEAAYELDFKSLLLRWANVRYLSMLSGLFYVYELYGTLCANNYYDWGLWRALQASLFLALTFGRFLVRIRQLRQ